jgi:hypothetical protein
LASGPLSVSGFLYLCFVIGKVWVTKVL